MTTSGQQRLVFALATAAWMAVALSTVQTSQAPNAPPAGRSRQVPASASVAGNGAANLATTIDRYCVGCHNQRVRSGGIALDTVDASRPQEQADVWERVITRLRAGSMPPAGNARPDQATYHDVVARLETAIDRAAGANPDPGRTSTVHRLNRTEYRNAIRDLLALDIDVAALLPGDETSDSGFDNNGDVLSIATAQLERYMSAARKITRLATGLPASAGFQTFDVPLLLRQDGRQSEELPLGSQGGVAVHHYFPADGEYLIKVRLRTNWQDYILGMGRPHQLDVRVDGALQRRFTVGGEAKGRPAPLTFTIAEFGDPSWEDYLHNADDQLEVRVPVKAGPRVVGVSFVRSAWEAEGVLQRRQAGEVLSNDEGYDDNAAVSSVAIGGPYAVTAAGDTPSRRAIFLCRPQSSADEDACARTILSTFARRAYRRPATDGDLRTLLPFFETGRRDGGNFDAGIQLALERLLVDPEFLLRIERDPVGVAADRPYRLSDLEVASRLSFFLWSSIPDQPLLALAERGRLRAPGVLEQQVRRMLADPRASAMVSNFAAQWLHLNNLSDVVGDPVNFPDFDDNLVEAFRTETELFIGSTLREDTSVLNLLSANYTFVNERLARHYGIPAVYGSRFRRVTLPDAQQRGGVLGHGGLLALTSYPTRTSPVLRGKWLLDTILGAPPPAPPPDVPDLPQSGEDGTAVSVRQRLERHRSSPACATCHSTIDPLGFALENFDGLGAWRTVGEGGKPLDATGTMPSGTRIAGLAGLRGLLLDQREQFAGTVTEKLMAYALGRALDYRDRPAVRQVVRDSSSRDYRWSSLILGVVESPAFQMRRSAKAN